MVTRKVATLDVVRTEDGIRPGPAPGLGATVDEDVLGDPVAVWG